MQATIGDSTDMLPSDRFMQMEEEEQMEQEERKRHRDPPIVFKDLVDVKSEYQALSNLLEGKLNEEEAVCMQELEQYIIENEGSWALGDNFLNFVGELANCCFFLFKRYSLNNIHVFRSNSVRQIFIERYKSEIVEHTFRCRIKRRCNSSTASG